MRALIRSFALALTLSTLAAPVALAQEQQPEGEDVDPSDERATSFQAVEGPVTEDVPGGALMVAAYAAIWLLIFGYVFRLGRISAQTTADVRRLERSLADAGGAGASDAGDGAGDEG